MFDRRGTELFSGLFTYLCNDKKYWRVNDYVKIHIKINGSYMTVGRWRIKRMEILVGEDGSDILLYSIYKDFIMNGLRYRN